MKEAGVRLPVDYPKKLVSQIPLTADTLCHTYADRVYKFGRLISMDAGDAEDLAQDALERAIRGLKTFNPAKGGVEGWPWRIVVNAGRDAGRIAGRQRLVFELLVDRWSPDENVVDFSGQLKSDEVLHAVRALSRRHRAVLALRFGADLGYRQVGQALGISEADAVVSPDGTRVAFTQGTYQCTNFDCVRLLIMSTDSKNLMELPLPPGFSASELQWSPDGNRLLFGSSDGVSRLAWCPGHKRSSTPAGSSTSSGPVQS